MRNEKHFKPAKDAPTRKSIRIGEVAQRTGVGVETLRFYERRGLLGRPRRTGANYRIYDEGVIEQVGFIKRAQAVGFTLDEVGEILAESASGRSPCREVRALARRKLEELDCRLAELHRYRDELARTLVEWDEQGEEAGHVCGLIEHSRVSAPESSGEGWRRAKKEGKR